MGLASRITAKVGEFPSDSDLRTRLDALLREDAISERQRLPQIRANLNDMPLDVVLSALASAASDIEYREKAAFTRVSDGLRELDSDARKLAMNGSSELIRRSLQRVPVDDELAERLRMVRSDGRNHSLESSTNDSTHWLSALVWPNRPTYDLARSYEPASYWLTHRVLDSISVDEVLERQGALRTLGTPNGVFDEYNNRFGCKVGYTYDRGWTEWNKKPMNVLPYVFWNKKTPFDHGRRDNRDDFVEYDVKTFGDALVWVEDQARRLDAPYFQAVADKVGAFRASETWEQMQALIAEATQDEFERYEGMMRSGMMRHMMVEDLMYDGGYADDEVFAEIEEHLPKVLPIHGNQLRGSNKWHRKHDREREKKEEGRKKIEIPTLTEALRATAAQSDESWRLVGESVDAIRDFEYTLTVAHAFDTVRAPTTLPEVGFKYDSVQLTDARNISLVLADDGPVIGNDVSFSPAQNTLILTGANGGGKTHLLEAIMNNQLLAHRGMRVVADYMHTPPLSGLEFCVDASLHGETASAFQNEVRKLKGIIERLEADYIPGERALVVLDEPFRGTDARDGVPLLIGLMKYMQDRGVYFAYSTHFNAVADCGAVMGKHGITGKVYTMDRKCHKLVEGVGRSFGIETAADLGFNEEILRKAKAVEAQADLNTIALNGRSKIGALIRKGLQYIVNRGWRTPETVSPDRFCFLSDDVYEELGIKKDERAGNALYGFTRRSYVRDSWGYNNKNFTRHFTADLDDETRAARITDINTLIKGRRYAQLGEFIEPYGCFEDIFQSTKRIPASIEHHIGGIEGLDNGFVQNVIERHLEGDRYHTFKRRIPKDGLSQLFENVKRASARAKELQIEGLEEATGVIDTFFTSEAYEEIQEFLDDFQLLDTGNVGHRNRERAFRFDDYCDWRNLCFDYQEELFAFYDAVLAINFYATVARTIDEDGWTRTRDATAPSMNVVAGRNTRLECDLSDETVTPLEITIDKERPVNILNGTNGGGKTQFLQTVGTMVYFRQQLGYVPAEAAEIGDYRFMHAMLSSSQHSQDYSSFQNEILKIKKIVDDYVAAGQPQDGLVILDEPFKGTSEEEAVPLLIGLIDYFSQRNVQVAFTTHFSGLYDALEKVEPGIAYHPLFVDYFSETERFKVREGRGTSSGIRVAEMMGIPEQIIAVAKEVAEAYQ